MKNKSEHISHKLKKNYQSPAFLIYQISIENSLANSSAKVDMSETNAQPLIESWDTKSGWVQEELINL